MTEAALRGLQIAVASAFLLTAVLAFRLWWLRPQRGRAYMAGALGCLGLVALVGAIDPAIDHRSIVSGTVIVLLMASAAGLLLYRHYHVPVPRWGWLLAAGVTLGALALAFGSGLPWAAAKEAGEQVAAADIFVGIWCLVVLESAYAIFRVSGRLARMQRARMRSLALGYLLIAIVLVASVATSRTAPNTAVGIGLEAAALLCFPPFLTALNPPRLVRRFWRLAEQDRLNAATIDLLVFSPDRATLAARSLEWAIRLVGGGSGVVADAGGALLAVQGMSGPDALALLSDRRLDQTSPVHLNGPRFAIVQPLLLQEGRGRLVVISEPLSPPFGRDEVEWLGAYAAAIGIGLDRVRVSELQQQLAAELRRARDRAEEANQVKSEFLSRMSHELRTPLTAMIGFAELLQLEHLTDKQARHVKTILKAGDHLLALINDILDIARTEEGRLGLSREPVNVSDTVSEVVDLMRPMAAERKLTVRVASIAAGLSVLADHQRLNQVLLNLVSNAVKYNHQGGLVEIEAAGHEAEVRISVRDSGPGLSDAELSRLFSPFERLSAASTEVEGTGLGLSLSKSLLEAMGGSIGVESAPGKGSTFWFQLPAGNGERVAEIGAGAPPRPRRDEAPEGPAGIVLYVEDNLSNMRLIDGILERWPGLRLITAMQGRMALDLATRHHPDLVLLDVHIPDMSGIEVLRRLAADPETAGVPVVVLSADATRAQRQSFLAAGAREYLTKPVRVTALLHALERHLASRRASTAEDAGHAGSPRERVSGRSRAG